jgi:hypothetical protein
LCSSLLRLKTSSSNGWEGKGTYTIPLDILCRHQDILLLYTSIKVNYELGVVAYICNPNTWEAKAGILEI